MIIARNPRLLSYLCTQARCMGILKIRFDPASRHITLINVSTPPLLVRWRHYLLAILATIYILQCIQKNNVINEESVLAWIFLIMFLGTTTYTFEVRRKAVEIRDCVEALFQMDSILPESPGVRSPRLLKIYLIFLYIVSLSAPAFPLGIVYGLHWGNPCRSTLVGYFLIPRCSSDIEATWTDFVVQICVQVVNHWIWSFVCIGTAFGSCLLNLLVVVAIQQLILRYEKLPGCLSA